MTFIPFVPAWRFGLKGGIARCYALLVNFFHCIIVRSLQANDFHFQYLVNTKISQRMNFKMSMTKNQITNIKIPTTNQITNALASLDFAICLLEFYQLLNLKCQR